MDNSKTLKEVADDLEIGTFKKKPVNNNDVLPCAFCDMNSIKDIIKYPDKEFHSLVINFKGITVGEFFDYLEESGIAYVTNEIAYDIVKKNYHVE